VGISSDTQATQTI